METASLPFYNNRYATWIVDLLGVHPKNIKGVAIARNPLILLVGATIVPISRETF